MYHPRYRSYRIRPLKQRWHEHDLERELSLRMQKQVPTDQILPCQLWLPSQANTAIGSKSWIPQRVSRPNPRSNSKNRLHQRLYRDGTPSTGPSTQGLNVIKLKLQTKEARTRAQRSINRHNNHPNARTRQRQDNTRLHDSTTCRRIHCKRSNWSPPTNIKQR